MNNRYDRHYIQERDPYKKQTNKENAVRNIYYGEVVDITDPYEGGRVRVRIPDFDNKTDVTNIPFAMPMLPKYFWILPKVGEAVRIFIEDIRYPQRGRHWLGSVISQPQKVAFDNYFTALATTNIGVVNPEPIPSSFPDSAGVFPDVEDIALIGRNNTDVILKDKEVLIRAGKHELSNVLALNKENPAFIQLNFTPLDNKTTQSSVIAMGDKIAIFSHDGIPKLKSNTLTKDDLAAMFDQGHPMVRGDLNVEALEAIRDAIIQHIHPYSGVVADPYGAIEKLKAIDFTKILQKNIVIN